MTAELDEKVAVVTGAARGIGEKIAETLAGAGAAVVIADRDLGGAERVAERLGREGHEAIAVGVDIADPEQVRSLFTAARERFGSVDVLVNNAAHARYDFAVDLPVEDWEYTLGVSLSGNFFCAQAAARIMREQGSGKIVTITSMAARVGLARTAAYAASKGGLEALTRVMAVELAADGIQVNAVAPGPVDTEFSREVVSEEGRAARLARMPAGELGREDEVAAAVLFLSSPASSWVNGAVLAVDGGFTIAGVIERAGAPDRHDTTS